MTNRSVIALLGGSVATAIAVIATVGRWPGRDTLATIATTAWTVFAVLDAADRVTCHIRHATIRLEQLVDERHDEGVIEGMRRATPTPGLREVR
jgi:hypothetical protein